MTENNSAKFGFDKYIWGAANVQRDYMNTLQKG